MPQENASVFTETGEIAIGSMQPARAKKAGCMGIYYGEGRGLDSCNIFGEIFEEDMASLQVLGEHIWLHEMQELTFEPLESTNL